MRISLRDHHRQYIADCAAPPNAAENSSKGMSLTEQRRKAPRHSSPTSMSRKSECAQAALGSEWFDNPANIDMTAALYLERFMNFGLGPEELQSGRPIIGIAQRGPDLVRPATAMHLELAAPRARRHPRRGRHRASSFRPIADPGDTASAPLPRSTATWRTLAWSRSFTATRSTAWCSPPAVTRPRPRS